MGMYLLNALAYQVGMIRILDSCVPTYSINQFHNL